MLLSTGRRLAAAAGRGGATAALALAAATAAVAAAPSSALADAQQRHAADADDDALGEGVAYRVYDGRTGAPRALSDIVDAALARPPLSGTVLLVGEAHDDAVAHAVERRLLREVWLRAADRPRVLCLEMFERDVQGVLDEVLGPSSAPAAAAAAAPAAAAAAAATSLPPPASSSSSGSGSLFREDDLVRDARPWPNYIQDYRPLVLDARAHGVRVVAANAPRRYVSVAGRHGAAALEAALPPGSPAREWLAPLPHALASVAYAERIEATMRAAAEAMRADGRAAAAAAAAGGAAPAGDDEAGASGGCPYTGLSVSSNFLAAQGLWDATMAWTIAQELARGGQGAAAAAAAAAAGASRAPPLPPPPPPPPPPIVALVAGRFHIEHGLGVAEHLAGYCGGGGGGGPAGPAVATASAASPPPPPPPPPHVVSVSIVQSGSVAMGAQQLKREGALGLADFLVLSDGKLPPSFRTVHL
jgi:hypothetical protein